jgi:hypothetical protein
MGSYHRAVAKDKNPALICGEDTPWIFVAGGQARREVNFGSLRYAVFLCQGITGSLSW